MRQTHTSQSNQQTTTALIIDDEKDICFLLGKILQSVAIQTHSAYSLADARNMLTKISPDVVFLDNHLPDGFGIQFIRHIKQDHPRCKVIMITAHDTVADREKAHTENADLFIGKPFSKDTIFKALNEVGTSL